MSADYPLQMQECLQLVSQSNHRKFGKAFIDFFEHDNLCHEISVMKMLLALYLTVDLFSNTLNQL